VVLRSIFDELVEARERLITNIQTNLTSEEKEFLLSFKSKDPQWVKLGLAAAKAHHINIRLKPRTPLKVVQAIREQYSKFIEVVDTDNSDDELVDISTTEWFKKIDSEMKPKDYLKTYRKVHNLTQSQLSEKISVSVQYLSDMETGKRTISRKKAKELAEIFGCNPGVFI
jgi:DNA-binding XRE family transcriptional regulator